MTLIWSADPANGPAYFSQFAAHQGAQTVNGDSHDAITIGTYAGRPAAQFTVHDSDITCLAANRTNPAAALLTKYLFHDGDDRYIRWSIAFPETFPKISTWLQVAEIYGAPWNGPPVLGLDVHPDDCLGWFRDASHRWDEPWKVPLARGSWHDVVLHVHFSPDPSKGFVEIWHNGQLQTLNARDPLSGRQISNARLYGSTLIPNVTWIPPTATHPHGGMNAIWCDCYFQKGMLGPQGQATIYHGPVKVGTALTDVT